MGGGKRRKNGAKFTSQLPRLATEMLGLNCVRKFEDYLYFFSPFVAQIEKSRGGGERNPTHQMPWKLSG